MLSSTVKSRISSKLKNIYSRNFNNKDLKIFSDEIFGLIKISNKKISKAKTKKLKISEDTTVVICYGDSVYENGKINSIKSFKNFYNKNLSRYFNTIHFLPFYPSSSDSGFAVNIMKAGEAFYINPMDTPFIPTWSRVKSAIPDFLVRLNEAVSEDNKKFI